MTQPVLFRLNYPVTTKEAQKFWASRHVCNQVKAICAFSLDEANANDNLRRAGFSRGFRKRAVNAWKNYINMPAMDLVPFTPLGVEWWDCLPLTPEPPAKGRWVKWDDAEKWLDPDKWVEWIELTEAPTIASEETPTQPIAVAEKSQEEAVEAVCEPKPKQTRKKRGTN